jgi:hypothetical protein
MKPEATVIFALNEFGDPDLGGWWLGLIIGFVVVVVVVVVVGTLLALTRHIGEQVKAAVGLLEAARLNTEPLIGLHRTNQTLLSIAGGAVAARKALGG